MRTIVMLDSGSCRDVINAAFSDELKEAARSAFIAEVPVIPEIVEGFARGISVQIDHMASWHLTFRESEDVEAVERIDFVAVENAADPIIIGMPTLDRFGVDWDDQYVYFRRLQICLPRVYPPKKRTDGGHVLRIGEPTSISEGGGVLALKAPKALARESGKQFCVQPLRDDVIIGERCLIDGEAFVEVTFQKGLFTHPSMVGQKYLYPCSEVYYQQPIE